MVDYCNSSSLSVFFVSPRSKILPLRLSSRLQAAARHGVLYVGMALGADRLRGSEPCRTVRNSKRS